MLDVLLTGESYVCASNDSFKKIDYSQNMNPNWSANVRTSSSLSIRLRQQVSSQADRSISCSGWPSRL